MTAADLAMTYRKEVSRPTQVQGDPWEFDASTADIERLLDSPPESLIAEDFQGYLGYCTTGGDDDLRYLFPTVLRIWEEQLYERDSWFTQYFHAEVCRTDFVDRALSPQLKAATYEFMLRAFSQRIGAETSLSVHGSTTSHDWVSFVASFGVFTTGIASLWSNLWHSESPGHATALLQYLSCLLYTEVNPIFAPWTCDKGGGAPQLWSYDSVWFGESWKAENLAYFTSALSAAAIREWLARTSKRSACPQIAEVANLFLHRLDECAVEVDQRIELLLFALRVPSDAVIFSWESLLDNMTRPTP